MADAHVYPASGVNRMIADVKKTMKEAAVLDRRLDRQREVAAMAESAKRYRYIFKMH